MVSSGGIKLVWHIRKIEMNKKRKVIINIYLKICLFQEHVKHILNRTIAVNPMIWRHAKFLYIKIVYLRMYIFKVFYVCLSSIPLNHCWYGSVWHWIQVSSWSLPFFDKELEVIQPIRKQTCSLKGAAFSHSQDHFSQSHRNYHFNIFLRVLLLRFVE